jgi:hypothetical protein
MFLLGLVLAIVGWLTGIGILITIGIIVLIIGLVLLVLSFTGGAAAGPAPWYRRRYY